MVQANLFVEQKHTCRWRDWTCGYEGGRGWMNWETGIHMSTPPWVKQVGTCCNTQKAHWGALRWPRWVGWGLERQILEGGDICPHVANSLFEQQRLMQNSKVTVPQQQQQNVSPHPWNLDRSSCDGAHTKELLKQGQKPRATIWFSLRMHLCFISHSTAFCKLSQNWFLIIVVFFFFLTWSESTF